MRWALAFVPLCWCTLDTTPHYADNVRAVGSSASDEGYQIASEILRKSINFSVNPCDDFYEFTCGNWIASHPIPAGKRSFSYLEILTEKIQQRMRDLLESNDVFEPKAVSALKAFYKKCMDQNELNRIGAKRLIESVKSIGVWPALEGDDTWRAENYNLTSLLIHVYQRRAVLAFTDVKSSIFNSSVHLLIQFDQGRLLMDKKSYLDREKNGTYIDSLKKLLTNQIEQFQKDAGLPINTTKTKKDVDEIIDLEMEMARSMVGNVKELHPRIYHLSDMRELLPLVNWTQFFNAVAPYNFQNYLYSDPKIIVVDLDYMNRVKDLLQSTDSRIVTNYVFMLYSRDWSGEMGEKYEDIEQEYNKVMFGQRQKKPRWQFCASRAMKKISYATAALYVKKALHKTTKEDTMGIADALKEELRKILNTSDWIDDESRIEELNKLDHMIRQIAYPKTILDEERLDDYYGDLEFGYTDSFSEMMEKVARWQIERFFEQLKTVQDRFIKFNCADVRATYNLVMNSLQISAAILQPPFFHHTFPRALNYGGIGAIIGHEITHGFDNKGRLFDAFGELRPGRNDYDVEKEYKQRSQCLINQYGKIEVPGTGHKIDGERTLRENIADHGGVKLAYRVSCNHETNDSLIDTIRNNDHAPYRYRVNQVLANQPEFAAAFHCDVGSAMNPTERCAFW